MLPGIRGATLVVAASLVGALAALGTVPPADPVTDAGGAPAPVPPEGPAYGTYAWPVEGPVLRRFDPPGSPYGAGHRGVDIASPVGSRVRSATGGLVAFAGPVAGGLYVSVDHPDGVRTTYSWLAEVLVEAGDPVDRGAVLGRSGPGHPGVEPPHLHFGARLGSVYLDPMLLLERGGLVGLVRLAPLDGSGAERGPPPPP